jgi:hypothetical protein
MAERIQLQRGSFHTLSTLKRETGNRVKTAQSLPLSQRTKTVFARHQARFLQRHQLASSAKSKPRYKMACLFALLCSMSVDIIRICNLGQRQGYGIGPDPKHQELDVPRQTYFNISAATRIHKAVTLYCPSSPTWKQAEASRCPRYIT